MKETGSTPTFSAWKASLTRRFRQMSRGWLRLLIVIYCVALAATIVAAVNCSRDTDQDTFAGIAAAIFYLYWPAVRIWLWVYDGFRKDKKPDAANLGSDKNRNN